MKQFGIGCLGVVIGLVAGLALAFAAAQQMPGNTSSTTTPPTSTADVTITANAAFINSQLQQAVRQSGLAKQATVAFVAPNLIQVSAKADVSALGFPIVVDATVAMRVSVQRGRIVLAVDHIDAGGVPIPASAIGSTVEKMRALSEDQINRLVQRALQGSGLSVSDVQLTPDAMTVDLVSQ